MPHTCIAEPSLAHRLFTAYVRLGWRGRRLLWSLLGRTPADTVRVRTTAGACFALNPWAHIDRVVIEEGYYETEVLEAVRPHLTDGTVFWDVGANFGLHAMSAALLARGATVVAFEPNPIEHARLLQHRAWNAPNVITSTLALSDANGPAVLHLGPAGNPGMSTLSPWSQARYSGTVVVAMARGDDVVKAGTLPAPNVIKLDVEGHEAAVLRGLGMTLARPGCGLVVFEDSPDVTESKSLLQAAGFAIERLVRHEPTAHGLENFVARKAPRR